MVKAKEEILGEATFGCYWRGMQWGYQLASVETLPPEDRTRESCSVSEFARIAWALVPELDGWNFARW
jgi:hypothetical protein